MSTTFSLDALCKIYTGQVSNSPTDQVLVRSAITSQIDLFSRTQISLAAEESGTEIPVVGTEAAGVLILSDREIELTLNGGQESLTLVPTTPGTKSIVLFCNSSITKVALSNPSDTYIATVDIILFA